VCYKLLVCTTRRDGDDLHIYIYFNIDLSISLSLYLAQRQRRQRQRQRQRANGLTPTRSGVHTCISSLTHSLTHSSAISHQPSPSAIIRYCSMQHVACSMRYAPPLAPSASPLSLPLPLQSLPLPLPCPISDIRYPISDIRYLIFLFFKVYNTLPLYHPSPSQKPSQASHIGRPAGRPTAITTAEFAFFLLPQNTTEGRRVRRRHEQWNGVPISASCTHISPGLVSKSAGTSMFRSFPCPCPCLCPCLSKIISPARSELFNPSLLRLFTRSKLVIVETWILCSTPFPPAMSIIN